MEKNEWWFCFCFCFSFLLQKLQKKKKKKEQVTTPGPFFHAAEDWVRFISFSVCLKVDEVIGISTARPCCGFFHSDDRQGAMAPYHLLAASSHHFLLWKFSPTFNKCLISFLHFPFFLRSIGLTTKSEGTSNSGRLETFLFFPNDSARFLIGEPNYIILNTHIKHHGTISRVRKLKSWMFLHLNK